MSAGNVALAVGISEKGTGLSALPALYNSSLKALQYRALDTGNEIIFFDEVNHMAPVSWIDLRGEFEEKLYTNIVTGNEEEALNILRLVLNPDSQDRSMIKSFFDNQMIQLSFILHSRNTKRCLLTC